MTHNLTAKAPPLPPALSLHLRFFPRRIPPITPTSPHNAAFQLPPATNAANMDMSKFQNLGKNFSSTFTPFAARSGQFLREQLGQAEDKVGEAATDDGMREC